MAWGEFTPRYLLWGEFGAIFVNFRRCSYPPLLALGRVSSLGLYGRGLGPQCAVGPWRSQVESLTLEPEAEQVVGFGDWVDFSVRLPPGAGLGARVTPRRRWRRSALRARRSKSSGLPRTGTSSSRRCALLFSRLGTIG